MVLSTNKGLGVRASTCRLGETELSPSWGILRTSEEVCVRPSGSGANLPHGPSGVPARSAQTHSLCTKHPLSGFDNVFATLIDSTFITMTALQG